VYARKLKRDRETAKRRDALVRGDESGTSRHCDLDGGPTFAVEATERPWLLLGWWVPGVGGDGIEPPTPCV
jgi:hypothetical protein